MNTLLLRGSLSRPRALLVALIGIVAGALAPLGTPAQAQGTPQPPVRYDELARIIYIGAGYNAADPAQAPFVGYPSRNDAPKQPISIPQLRTALNAQLGAAEAAKLLEDQGKGAWLLKADVVVSPTARLDMTKDSISWLRLDSTPDRFPALTRLVATGGYLRIEGVRVSSWDRQTGTVDTTYLDGRSFLLAQTGGRLDIIDAEVDHLGWADGEPSGLSWRKRATPADPRTGATGIIRDSDIHSNYFGQYSYEAYGLKVTNNEFHHNVYYGFDPHDFSIGFEVAYNKVYNNGKHGIIFSRGCEQNWIHHNEVYNNAEHGIMLDRGTNNNKISDNLVYNNRDGVAIFQSSSNLVQNNILRDNERGVRINATYDATDEFDGISILNTVISNTIQNNSQYGIYFYERADKNTIAKNLISGNAESGVYIKTGGNTIVDNSIRTNGVGVTIIGGPLAPFPPAGPTPVPAEGLPGAKNVIARNTIEDNNGAGVRVRDGSDTLIGARDPQTKPQDGNTISANGRYGVVLETGVVDTMIAGNTIHANGADGVLVKGVDSIGNTISRNSIAVNAGLGVRLSDGANTGVLAPSILSAPDSSVITGTTAARATVEVYRDTNLQGRVYVGTAMADTKGAWSLARPAGDDPAQGALTALATLRSGDTSAFGGNSPGGGGAQPVYEIGVGQNGEVTIYISGPGTSVTLPAIAAGVKTLTTTTLLDQQADGVWLASASLFVNRGVTLTLASDTVSWLRLRSQADDIRPQAAGEGSYNYKSFTSLRTYNGTILIDGARVTSWDPAANTYDTDVSNGRSYVLAKYAARLDIKNADMSYLGSADGESYGVSWRDVNSSEAPTETLTRVTGDVVGSTFSYNYYGIYTYQASNMLFRGNKFHNNIGYGFDPHDYTHHVVVEDNEAFENGNHGFIISRGCNNFIFRRNKSYNNRYSVGDDDRNAHGFMIDPGSPNSRYTQVPSFDNLLEQNEAWGNDGYGLRILGSISNTVRANIFRDNLQGITVERGSTNTVIAGNTISGSALYGIFAYGGSDGTVIEGNTISGSGRNGIYLKSSGNRVVKNTITGNGTRTAEGPVGAGVALFTDSSLAALREDLTLPGERRSLADDDPTLLSASTRQSAPVGNQIRENIITGNVDDGVEVKGARDTLVEGNTIERNGAHGIYLATGARKNMVAKNRVVGNGGQGIRANGADSAGNSWSENAIFENGGGGIVTTSGANDGLKPPTIIQLARVITGTTTPGAVVEVFSDDGHQGLYFEGRTTAKADGSFKFTAKQAWRGRNVNAVATDEYGNSSGFTRNVALFVGDTRLYLPLVRVSGGK